MLDGGLPLMASAPSTRVGFLERACQSCGREPGAGSFCQHCGTKLADMDQPADTQLPGPAPAQTPPQSTPTTTPGQNPPPVAQPPAMPPQAGATPPVVASQPVKKRSGCLTGGLIVGGLVLLGIVVGGFFVWRWVSKEILPEVDQATESLTAFSETPPGPCIDVEGEDGVLTSWTEADCSGPRMAEITYSAAFNDGPFPGDEYLADNAASTCRDAFEGYVGVPPEQSEFEYSWIVPTAETWAAGSRHGICLAITGDGSDITGELKGSNR